MISGKRNAPISILSLFGHLPLERDTIFCRRCGKGHGIIDETIGINQEHRMTKGMIEMATYVAQLLPSFERASEALKKMMEIDMSATQLQIVSEKIGKAIFEKDMAEAEKIYEKPEESVSQELPKNRKEGVLYILTDGSQINTRVEDENGSTWKEMKLGLIFSDRNIIRRSDGHYIITKKEYVTYFGNVSEFKKIVFAAAARAGYGKIKEVVVIGDGAAWIWNMYEELFPDAVKILDYYHLSENVHEYSKALYPDDEVNRKRWVNQVLDKVNNGQVDEAIKTVENSKISKVSDTLVNLPYYMKNNRKRIEYKYFKDKDYYIGSGPIESGNKVVIQQRMKQSGMRWGLEGGQHIASLRAKYESNKWNDVVNIVNG